MSPAIGHGNKSGAISFWVGSAFALAWLTVGPALGAQSDQKEFLTPSEIDQIREAQDINERVPLYLEFAQVRLLAARKLAGLEEKEKPDGRSKGAKGAAVHKPTDEKKEPERTLSDYLEEFDGIYEEMLRHLDEFLDHGGDARKALKAILKESPLHQSSLKSIEAKLGEEAPNILSESLSDTADAIEGSQKTLLEQEEKFKQEKERQKEKPRE
jgi:hypothetical protein